MNIQDFARRLAEETDVRLTGQISSTSSSKAWRHLMQRWMVRRLPIRQQSAVMWMVESRLPGVPAPLRVQIRFSSDPELITFIRRRVGDETEYLMFKVSVGENDALLISPTGTSSVVRANLCGSRGRRLASATLWGSGFSGMSRDRASAGLSASLWCIACPPGPCCRAVPPQFSP